MFQILSFFKFQSLSLNGWSQIEVLGGLLCFETRASQWPCFRVHWHFSSMGRPSKWISFSIWFLSCVSICLHCFFVVLELFAYLGIGYIYAVLVLFCYGCLFACKLRFLVGFFWDWFWFFVVVSFAWDLCTVRKVCLWFYFVIVLMEERKDLVFLILFADFGVWNWGNLVSFCFFKSVMYVGFWDLRAGFFRPVLVVFW